MSPTVQVLILLVGTLISALLALLLAQVTGMRSDFRMMSARQDAADRAREELKNEFVALKAEHNSAKCVYRKESR